jgi:peroxiredoxin (alkyl hydroperoxide reductase subunit C)
MAVQVGREAPKFVAEAYHGGNLTRVKLSDYRGQWVLIFFYPADFTIV